MTGERGRLEPFPLGRLISGGQTGVDRAALEFALAAQIACGGWCPAGRRSEAGPIPDRFPLLETSSPVYPQRTRLNVRDSDATLIFTIGEPSGGTALTVGLARRLRKPCLILDLAKTSVPFAARRLVAWLGRLVSPVTLNVAGPRGSECPGLACKVQAVLKQAVTTIPAGETPPAWPPLPDSRQPCLPFGDHDPDDPPSMGE